MHNKCVMNPLSCKKITENFQYSGLCTYPIKLSLQLQRKYHHTTFLVTKTCKPHIFDQIFLSVFHQYSKASLGYLEFWNI